MGEQDDNESEGCCGNGCNNCILDRKVRANQQNTKDQVQKINILSQNYQKFNLKSVKKLSQVYWQFKFELSNKDEINNDRYNLYVPPGFHLYLRVLIDENTLMGTNVKHDAATIENYNSRPYTPIAVYPDQFQFEIIVKLEGSMCNFFRQLTIGDHAQWKGVYGEFIWKRNQHCHLVGFVQGVGIAPIYRLMHSILDDEEDNTRIELYSCFRDAESILLRDEVHSMRQFWNFKASVYLSQAHGDWEVTSKNIRLKYNEVIHGRRLVEDDVREIVGRLNLGKSMFVICGTNSFIGNIKKWLQLFNIQDDKLFVYQ